MMNETTLITCIAVIIIAVMIILMRNYANDGFIEKLKEVDAIMQDPDMRQMIVDKYGQQAVKDYDAWITAVLAGLEDGKLTMAEAIAIAKTSYPLVKKVLWAIAGALPVITAYFA